MAPKPGEPAVLLPGTAPTFEDLARAQAEGLGHAVDLDVLSVALNIIRVANLLIQDLESRVHRPSGWSWAGFRVMFAVLVRDAAEPREVARLAGVSRASVSGVLNTLERDGLVVRERSSADRRVVTVRLTGRGRRATLRAFKKNHEIEKAWLATLTESEIQTLISLLHRIHSPLRTSGALTDRHLRRARQEVAQKRALRPPAPSAS